MQNSQQGVLLTWCCHEPVPDRKTLREGKIDSVSWFQSIMAGSVLGPVVRQSIAYLRIFFKLIFDRKQKRHRKKSEMSYTQ